MTKEIELTQGKFATVDDEDFKDLSRYKWFAHSPDGQRWYAMRNKKLFNGRKTTISMHVYLMKSSERATIDHIDGNGLNNTRKNLRFATNKQNCSNSKISKNNTSGYKGVHFYTRTGRWQAFIHNDYKKIHLGYFDSPEDAARAYDRAAVRYHGEFASLNFPAKKSQPVT